jgi:diacylglycerol kinase family enzyme
MLSLHEFSDMVFGLFGFSPLFADKRVYVDFIANPTAGGFTIKLLLEKHEKHLEESYRYASSVPPNAAQVYGRLFRTERKGHAIEFARRILKESLGDEPGSERVIVTAGGDGTSLEVQGALMEADPAVRKRVAILRLPMGTGNDGSDGKTLESSLKLLTMPSEFFYAPALKVTVGGRPARHAFNIASAGLDAYVTMMTNKLKGKVPGDSYRLWVDLASVFYPLSYPTVPTRVRAWDQGGALTEDFEDGLLLAAMGVSGRRFYGSGIPILPDDRNVCAVRDMPLLRKLALKGKFKVGAHAEFPETRLFSASRIEISRERPVLIQLDGEAELVRPEDFPVTMEITEPSIRRMRLI